LAAGGAGYRASRLFRLKLVGFFPKPYCRGPSSRLDDSPSYEKNSLQPLTGGLCCGNIHIGLGLGYLTPRQLRRAFRFSARFGGARKSFRMTMIQISIKTKHLKSSVLIEFHKTGEGVRLLLTTLARRSHGGDPTKLARRPLGGFTRQSLGGLARRGEGPCPACPEPRREEPPSATKFTRHPLGRLARQSFGGNLSPSYEQGRDPLVCSARPAKTAGPRVRSFVSILARRWYHGRPGILP
jgi:hypothetical protein